ncbi:MAG: energy transducer TonB [Nitrospinota bacterium]|nr:energy transducer TonB [Nitrospinota bacterium]
MPINRFDIQEAPRLQKFVLISLGLHIAIMVAQGLMPDEKQNVRQFPPVKVTYLPPEKQAPPAKAQTLVDAPKPQKTEAPKSSELIAKYDSRAHANQNPGKHLIYKNKKTVVPKTNRSDLAKKPSKNAPKTFRKPAPTPKTIKKPYQPSDKGFELPKTKGQISEQPTPKQIAGGTLALLDGFDPEKYAALDTDSPQTEDDDEVISLDTKESKYASYFARIKHQIERVWTYPEDAARNGVSGRLTLRFQISKDGNLMNVRLITDSGHVILDEAALQAVKSAAPYYPFPVTIDRESLSILATFIYNRNQGSQTFPVP